MIRTLTTRTRRPRRRGVILVVVLALLTLFAIIGISFVFYSDSEATGARIHREGQSNATPGQPDPTDTVNTFIGNFLFDTQDTGNDLSNALRGHSLMATLYGRIPGANVPYNGVGTFHEVIAQTGLDRVYHPNYTAMTINGAPFLLDPEWTNTRPLNPGTPNSPPTLAGPPSLANPGGRSYIPKNAAYTYPDANNFFLAAISPATGEVLVPSFYRWWMWNATNPDPTDRLTPPVFQGGPLGVKNPDWVSPQGRAMTLRPRPVDQLHPNDSARFGVPVPFPANPTAAQLNALQNMIASGEIIGYPPASASVDSSGNVNYVYTGDVQNLWGGVGSQVNDSLLMDIGMPVRMWNGKLIKPLVAPLIVDLDGRLNVNAQGALTPRASYAGYGVWEMNPATVVNLGGTEFINVLNTRYGPAGTNVGPTSRTGVSILQYDPMGTRLPAYGLVNWDGSNGSGSSVSPPSTTNLYQTTPTFTGSFDDNVGATPPPASAKFHPGLFNPAEWQSNAVAGTGRTFPLSDFKRLNTRYADKLEVYQSTDIGQYAPQSLRGNTGAGNTYRLDPSHPNRLALTTLSTGFDVPGLMANFNAVQQGLALQLSTTYPYQPAYPGAAPPYPFPGQVPNPGTVGLGPITDYKPANSGAYTAEDWRHQRAGLGGIDLNRPLATYWGPNTPPTPGVPANFTQAWADRHNLARDVFARLIVAAGAAAYVDTSTGNVYLPQPAGMGGYQLTIPTTGATVPVGPQEYNALRYLAQLAANIVDYIDGDDVSTVFIWNPPGAASPPAATALLPGQLSFTSNPAIDFQTNLAPADMTQRVVIGVEKPKLVLNEAYSEITNDPSEKTTDTNKPQKPARVRFWVELLNPTGQPYTLPGPNGAQGAGAAQVRYDAALGDPTTYNPYKLVVARFNKSNGMGGPQVRQYLQDPSNVTGDLPTPLVADIDYDFTNANAMTGGSRIIAPNNGVYAAAGNPAQGVVLVGPTIPAAVAGAGPQPFEFNPTTGMGAVPPYSSMIQSPSQGAPNMMGPQNAMEYMINPVPDTTAGVSADLQQHVVLLRRLANPYLPPNDPSNPPNAPPYNPAAPVNPYVTVDYMDFVPAFDAINRGPNDTTTARQPKAMGTPGYDPMGTRFALGKVQPYAGLAAATITLGSAPTYSFPTSCVLPQSPAGYNAMTATEPMHTFGRHNGMAAGGPGAAVTPPADTIMAPYDWLVHLDRTVANQLELLQVRGGKPHELTQLFLWPSGAASVRRDIGLVPWLGVNPTAAPPPPPPSPGYDTTTNLSHNGLFRAMELLRVKPWGYGNGLGGRVHGRVNLNTVQDLRVFQGVVNEPSGGIAAGTSASLWSGVGGMTPVPGFITNTPGAPMAGSRTPNAVQKLRADGSTASDLVSGYVPVPGATVDDAPFGGIPGYNQPLDRPFKSFGVGEFSQSVSPAYGANSGSGLPDTLLRVNPSTGQPFLWMTGQTNPYLQAELARKLANNVTTVSNTFAVYITVVYHEVRMYNGSPLTDPNTGGNTGLPLRYLLGREAFREVPGDLRQQFFAVVDRTNVGLVPGAATPTFSTTRPVYTRIQSLDYTPPPPGGAPPPKVYLDMALSSGGMSPQLLVYADGQPVAVGGALVVGTGVNQEVVAITQVNADGSVNVSGFTKPHYAGEVVSNVIPGNPGPQPGFDRLTNPNSAYLPAVPYVARVR